MLAAEMLYHKLLCDGTQLVPGWRSTLTCVVGGATFENIETELRANAVWRRGRLFFQCRNCGHSATRLYIPIEGYEPRCRRCWGLSYQSQSRSYKPCGLLGRLFGPIAHETTLERRKRRQQAARARYDARRAFL